MKCVSGANPLNRYLSLSRFFLLRDQLRNLRIRSHRLDRHHMLQIEIHPVGMMPFASPPDQNVLRLLGRRILHLFNIVNIPEKKEPGMALVDFSIEESAIVEKDGLIRRRQRQTRIRVAGHLASGYHDGEQTEGQKEPDRC